MTIHEMAVNCEEELLDRLGRLVRIKSVRSEPLPDAPFGAGPRQVLDCALEMLKEDGFRTVDVDHYAGYAEMGKGEQVIGIIGHLDVVPASEADGWHTDPFCMQRIGDTVYGRGTADDKGAVVSAMMAMKIVRDLGVPLKKRVRLIMGTNEESGSACMKYYVQKCGSVDYGFTPDGEFPGVYGEKGILAGTYRSKKTEILDIKGGTAGNVVAGKCTAEVKKNSYSSKKLADFFHQNSIAFQVEEKEDRDVIAVDGKPAHAAVPWLGVNAISCLLCGLKEAGFSDPFVDFYCSHFGLYWDGTLLGCKCSDEYGELTDNQGVISMEDGTISGTINIRFPVTMSAREVLDRMQDRLEDANGIIEFHRSVDPLFFPPDSVLVTSLVDAYRSVTGDTEAEPLVIGGGTYAKTVGNTIAFGCAFPGYDYHLHDADENCPVDHLLKQVEIYVQAILNLNEAE